MFEENKHLRVRIVDDTKSFICFKTLLDDVERIEYEYEIPIEDALEMYKTTIYKIEKTRYSTEYKGNKIDIDCFDKSTVVAEIEFTDNFEIPPYLGEEITNVKEYSNIWRAKNNFERMNIFAVNGYRVMVTEETKNNGYNDDKENVKSYLKPYKIYTVKYTMVEGYDTTVFLNEIPNIGFNSVNFVEIEPQDIEVTKEHSDFKRFNR